MAYYVVRSTWLGAPGDAPAEETRLVAGCSGSAEAEGLAGAEAQAHFISGRDPDSGHWWASDTGAVHRIEVTSAWPAPTVHKLKPRPDPD